MNNSSNRGIADTINPLVRVSGLRVFEDASGVTATMSYNGYVFACNWLGGVSLNCIKPLYGSRRDSKIAADVCRRAFAQLVMKHTDEKYRAACAEMYGVPA